MGVYIKDRDMPDTCGSCPCFHAENPMYCQAVKAAVQKPRIVHPYAKGRPEWCPLIEIQPHGRLIDADVLVERIDGIWDCNDMFFRPNDKICNIPEDCKGCKWAQTKDCIQRMVENAPTIIPTDGDET